MSEEKTGFKEEVRLILEILMFENWLRFYFIKEEKSKDENDGQDQTVLKLELPEKALNKIKELYPDFYPLAREMNGRVVDFEISRRAVMGYVMEALDGTKIPRGEAQRVLGSAIFQTDLQLFHTWVQMHENQLDQGFADFGSWRDMFAKWKESPAAQNLAADIMKSLSGSDSGK